MEEEGRNEKEVEEEAAEEGCFLGEGVVCVTGGGGSQRRVYISKLIQNDELNKKYLNCSLYEWLYVNHEQKVL